MHFSVSRTQAKPQGSGRSVIPGLDGIRGLAVLTVFVFHAEILRHVPGELATTVFFFLSGFLITTLFVREWNKTGSIDLGAFYTRRALRILPPLYIVLGLAFAAYHFLHVGDKIVPWKAAGNFLQYTNMAAALPREASGFLPGMLLLWSLAVDEHYYLLFAPIFRRCMGTVRIRRMCASILVLCAAALAWRIWLVHMDGAATYRVSFASDTRMDSILWGALLALWRNPAQNAERAAWLAKPLPVALGAILVLAPSLTGNDSLKCTVGYTLEGIGLMPLFAAAILNSQKGMLAFLNKPWLVWFSKISYPLYLIQWLLLLTIYKYVHLPKVAQVLVAFAGAFIFASAMHIWLERPLMSLRKKTRLKKQDSASPTTISLEPAAVAAAS